MVEMVPHEEGFGGVATALMTQLNEQAFLERSCADADGVETLNDGNDTLKEFFGKFGGGADDAVEVELKIAIVVDASNEDFGDAAFVGVESGHRNLVDQMFLQGFDAGDGIHHELMFVLSDFRANDLILLKSCIPLGEFGEFPNFAFFTQFLAGGFLEVGHLFHVGGLALECGVLIHFFANHQLEVENRDLKDFQGLKHLRRERLLHPLLLN